MSARPADPSTRHCLVTGASSGIGRAVAERLAGDGWDVTVLVRRDEAPAGTRVIVGDATSADDLERAIAAATGSDGVLHGLVCAAGVPPSGPWDDTDHWAEVLRVDLTAAYDAARIAWPGLIGGTRIGRVRGQHRGCRRGVRPLPGVRGRQGGSGRARAIARGHRRTGRRARERGRAGCHRHALRYARVPRGCPTGCAPRAHGHGCRGSGGRRVAALAGIGLRDGCHLARGRRPQRAVHHRSRGASRRGDDHSGRALDTGLASGRLPEPLDHRVPR